jgi:hypothetical protein
MYVIRISKEALHCTWRGRRDISLPRKRLKAKAWTGKFPMLRSEYDELCRLDKLFFFCKKKINKILANTIKIMVHSKNYLLKYIIAN